MRTTHWLATTLALTVTGALFMACETETVEEPAELDRQSANLAIAQKLVPASVLARDPEALYADRLFEEGREVFRHETFGSEGFWGGQMRLHEAIAGAALGGLGHRPYLEARLQAGLLSSEMIRGKETALLAGSVMLGFRFEFLTEVAASP